MSEKSTLGTGWVAIASASTLGWALVGVCMAIGASPAWGQCADEQKLTASDGAQGDVFGVRVSVSGDTAVVGSDADDDAGSTSGSAYVFVRSGGAWIQQQKLTALDAAAGDFFGTSVSVSGDTAVVGSDSDDDAGTDSGSAYVFVRSGAVWTQQQKLTASDGAAGDRFGISVSLSGDTAVVGAFHDDGAGTDSGSAYVFVRSGAVWTQQQKLTASDAASGDAFGSSVSVSGDTAVVGASRDNGVGTDSGSAYVFVRSGAVWTQPQKLTASDAAAGDFFGGSVSVSGDTAVVGANLDTHAGGANAGSAYVFVRSGAVWPQQQKLTALDAAASDAFGTSVSVSGDTVVVGAYQDDDAGSGSGSAYVFVRSGGVWTPQPKLTAFDAAANDAFGISISVSGDTAVVGAYQDDDAGLGSGSAYVFQFPCAGPPIGACCIGGTSCVDSTQGFCELPAPNGLGGVYLGDGTMCPTQNVLPVNEGNGTVFVHSISAPVDCNPQQVRANGPGCPGTGPYFDPWISHEGAEMCHNFGSPDTDPIPIDFFDPDSDPFTSTVCMRGVPLGNPQYGDADTLISRNADPFDRCDLPSGDSSMVNIEITALSLESIDPITVTYGGSNPETWNVTVDLSPGGLPPGTPPRTLTATKTHCNGGTYTSVLYVQPRFTFTKVSNPSEVRVLDTGMMGTPPVELVQSDPHPWVSDIDPFLGAQVDLCSDFHANISQDDPLSECDCNTNARRDLCDIELGISQDCNTNLKPDECDIDDGTSLDENNNGIPDECDSPLSPPTIGDNTCQTSGADLGTPCGTDADCTAAGSACGNKSRYISVTPTNVTVAGETPTSIQVEIVTMPQFPARVGEIWWAGMEQNMPNAPNPSLRGAPLLCEATPTNAQVWTLDVLHLFGSSIVPGSTYNVRMCDASGATCSDPLVVATGKWGDIIRPFGGISQPAFGDINEIVFKFRNLASSQPMPRVDLVGVGNPGQPNTPNQTANFADIGACVEGFRVIGFAYTVPACP